MPRILELVLRDLHALPACVIAHHAIVLPAVPCINSTADHSDGVDNDSLSRRQAYPALDE